MSPRTRLAILSLLGAVLFGIALAYLYSTLEGKASPSTDVNLGSSRNTELSSSRASSLPIVVPANQSFFCTPVRVWDGDGPIWCAEGPRVRLAGVAARESDESCRSNQPCPDASAADARDSLVELIGEASGVTSEGHVLVNGPPLDCLSKGGAGGNRTAAWCESPNVGDISCAMVETGTVLQWDVYWEDGHCA